MMQNLSIFLDGTNITNHINKTNVTENINRLYQVAVLESDKRFIIESEIKIIMGERIFEGFIFSITKQGEKRYTIECRSNSARLTSPYFSEGEYVLEDATTSHELCSLYSNKYGVPIINDSIDLDFNGNYERRGTPLDTLIKIANVTGAEFWYDGSNIRISPNKHISTMGQSLKDSDIFDFIPAHDTISKNTIGKIIISTSEMVSSIDTEMSCTATVDRCSGEATIRIIPHDSFKSSNNIELTEVKTPMLYQSVVPSTVSVKMEADIVSIRAVYLNGEEITDYSFLKDTVVFYVPKRGILMVDYIGYGYRGYTNIVRVGVDRYSEFDIFYGPCEKYSFQDNMNCKNEDGYSMCGGIFTMTPKEMNYAKGFTFYTIGGEPSIDFYSDTRLLTKTATTIHKSMDWVEQCTLSMEAGGIIRYRLRFLPTSISEVRAGGIDITSHVNLNGKYIEFDDIYTSVVIAYVTEGREHYVNFKENFPNENIRMLVGGDVQGGCEYNLSGYSQDSTSSTACVEGVTVPINMINELGVKPFNAVGKSILVTTPTAETLWLVTDKFGILKIPNIIFGEYLLDVNDILPNSKMKLIAGGS